MYSADVTSTADVPSRAYISAVQTAGACGPPTDFMRPAKCWLNLLEIILCVKNQVKDKT